MNKGLSDSKKIEGKKRKVEENLEEWHCPTCGWIFLAPKGAGVKLKCERCRTILVTSGIAVSTGESQNLFEEMEKRRRREIRARRESG